MEESAPRRILLVDDDDDIRTIATLGLAQVGGMEVQSCASGAEALKRIESFAPDVVLLDVMMSHMSGSLVCDRLMASSAFDGEVIFVTAKAQPHEVASYLARGAIGVIKKPFDPLTLADQISAIWRDSRRSSSGGGLS